LEQSSWFLKIGDFLRELKTEAFEVVDASMMLQKLEQGEVVPAESIIE